MKSMYEGHSAQCQPNNIASAKEKKGTNFCFPFVLATLSVPISPLVPLLDTLT